MTNFGMMPKSWSMDLQGFILELCVTSVRIYFWFHRPKKRSFWEALTWKHRRNWFWYQGLWTSHSCQQNSFATFVSFTTTTTTTTTILVPKNLVSPISLSILSQDSRPHTSGMSWAYPIQTWHTNITNSTEQSPSRS